MSEDGERMRKWKVMSCHTLPHTDNNHQTQTVKANDTERYSILKDCE